jgi:uncharacterized protein DUF1592/uncharacterized protein DUF1588/uncharacterized protein DUF1587/uncharacterized protein DUF1585/uncharacterized protein DUF1595/cbb3-type cytochrome c oxidase subunit III
LALPFFAAAAASSVAAIPLQARPGAQPLSAAERDFVRAAEPLFKQFCFDCHGDRKTKAGVNLQRMSVDPDFTDLFKTWEKVIVKLEQKEMPPEEEPQPTDAQRKKLIAGVRGGLDKFIRETAGDPGRVVLRKLTSAEYACTIHDLTGLDLELEKHFDVDPAGGEGFSNVGDVQFIQDSTLERYLEAAKTVAAHAVIGAGPLQFYRDPGKTGQELSAIDRIRKIYEQHGFRTGAGEGAVAFGLDHYPKAFFAAWRYRHRRELDLRNVTLARLAQEEGLDAPFVEHVWSVLNDPSLSFAAAEIAAAWRKLPVPANRNPKIRDEARAQCDALYKFVRNWQSAFAANTGNEEEMPVLSDNSFRPTLKHSFRALVNWPRGATNASFEIVAMPVSGQGAKNAVVVWRQPSIRFRQPGARGSGGGGRGRGGGTPLRQVVSAASAQQLKFRQGVNDALLGTNDFATVGALTLPIEFFVPAGAIGAEVTVDVELDLEHGDDALVRCAISSKVIEGQGQTAAATGVVSALLANPESPQLDAWKAGAMELARKLPQVSHREAAPADRDPIPPPWDNSYNNAERNDFHYVIKYHRDDRFLTEHILDAVTRAQLDQAWTDLLTSFGYHDTYIRFVAKKYQADFGERTVANLKDEWIDQLPEESRGFIKPLRDEHASMHRALEAAQPGHIEDALRFAQRAWRRPLMDVEKTRLRSFYASMKDEAKLDHAEAVRALLARILMAPAFLYRVESPGPAYADKGPLPGVRADRQAEAGVSVARSPQGRGVVPLSDWELASRLSYFLWSSIPDAELFRAAAAGELRKPEQLTRQAQRMLRDPKARRFATEFFGQWFGFYRFTDYRGVDTSRFTEFTDVLKASMYDEAVSFFEHIVREDRSVQDILFADYSFLNRDLARHYGIDFPAVPANGLARISGVDQFHRGGLLRLGAVLTATSAPLRTSAVKRGDWVLRRVLGTPIPPPPGDAGSIPPDDVLADGKTVRQRLEAHRRVASCVNCHSRIDPLGFALEHFDSIGRWRETYRDGQAIDATGTLSDGTVISELDGLFEYLRKQRSSFDRNLSAKLLGYALGRSEMVSDRPLLDQMVASLKKDSRFSTLVTHIVSSPQFRFQRRQELEGEPPERTAAVARPGRSAAEAP